jgi:LPXTG-motif cell wall-anchored protein
VFTPSGSATRAATVGAASPQPGVTPALAPDGPVEITRLAADWLLPLGVALVLGGALLWWRRRRR